MASGPKDTLPYLLAMNSSTLTSCKDAALCVRLDTKVLHLCTPKHTIKYGSACIRCITNIDGRDEEPVRQRHELISQFNRMCVQSIKMWTSDSLDMDTKVLTLPPHHVENKDISCLADRPLNDEFIGLTKKTNDGIKKS